jgi:molybdopterin synthase catalytic subunit
MSVRVQSETFDPGAELNAFTAAVDGAGAVVSFTGVVRDVSGGLTAMEIEHYPGMTQSALAKIVDEATARWDLAGALVIHRYGVLTASENIMMVATA